MELRGSSPKPRTSAIEEQNGAKLDMSRKGNPNLIYKNELVYSFEPSGVPASMNRRVPDYLHC